MRMMVSGNACARALSSCWYAECSYSEHVLSEYEHSAYQQDERARAQAFPLTIIRIQFDKEGKPTSGEVFPGARISVADDGLVDVETQAKNPAAMVNIVRQ